MISLWEKQSFLTYDVLVIGAGITGLSAAASLKENDPTLKVAVLERSILPSGASTKNAGFACFGSVSELLNDVNVLGEQGMVDLVMKRWDGLQKTSQRLGRSEIDLQAKGGYELVSDQNLIATDAIDQINGLLRPFFQEDVFQLANHKISDFQFGNTDQLIENTFEGQIDTGKMMSALWNYCMHLGIKIHTGAMVDRIQEEADAVSIFSGHYLFKAKKIAVCTNAFANALLSEQDLDVVPGRGIVMSIIPQKALHFEGTFHYDQGYYYFRDYYGKLLFGGGRNMALLEEQTTEFGINEKIKNKLIHDLQTIILPNQPYAIEMEWSGVMAFGRTKAPIVRTISDRMAIGVRLGGMGVAIGSLVGEEVAELLVQ